MTAGVTKRWASAVAAVALLAGCTHSQKEVARCPDSKDLFCLTAVECSMDKKRGCEVCQCSKGPGAREEDARLPSGTPPDRRLPED
jgi:hypothetical protein